MKYDTVMKPRFLDVNYEIRTQGSISDILEKTDDHIKQLKEQFCENSNSRILSPSALNTWLNCRMKFYYRYVNRLKESEKVTADIDAAMFGNILHECMKTLYHDFIGEELSNDHLDLIITNKQLLIKSMNDAINASFNKNSDSQISGNELLVREVLMAYLLRVLNTDKLLTPFLLLNLEDTFSFKISLISGGDQIEVLAGGKIDRVDTAGGVTRVVDYKTGSVADFINSIEELFIDDRKKDYDGWLQTLLYCEAYLDKNAGHIVLPAIYKIKKLRGNAFSDRLRIRIDKKNEIVIDDYNLVRDDFLINLKAMISNIFSKDEPFYKTCDARGKCSYCPYKALCMR
jgi:CRISPR/Cas system-associated exonuclease Cas4 (RecB family)